MSKRRAWEAKVEFAARRMADWDGKDYDRLPAQSRWFASKVRYRHLAAAAIGAGNLWEMMSDYREISGEPTENL